jgi:hypothetical protein
VLSRKKPGTIAAYLKRHPYQAVVLRALAGAVGAVLLLIIGSAVHASLTGRSLEESLGGAGHVWLLIAGVPLAGMAAALLVRRRPRRV